MRTIYRITRDVIHAKSLQTERGWFSLDDAQHAEAVAAALAGPDEFFDGFHANRPCGLLGARYLAPGQVDPLPTLILVAHEARSRGLDPIIDVLLDNLRVVLHPDELALATDEVPVVHRHPEGVDQREESEDREEDEEGGDVEIGGQLQVQLGQSRARRSLCWRGGGGHHRLLVETRVPGRGHLTMTPARHSLSRGP